MKVRHREIIGQRGEVRIPEDYQKGMGLCPGEEVEFRREGQGLLIERVKEAVAYKKKDVKDPVEALTGSLALAPELIDELVENEHLYEAQEVD